LDRRKTAGGNRANALIPLAAAQKSKSVNVRRVSSG
jgi:hypothetical protein